MKTYLTNGRYVGTQEEAKLRAKAHGNGWTVEIVPDDKPGLIAYLNRVTADSAVVGYNHGSTVTEDRMVTQIERVANIVGTPARRDPLDLDEAWERLPLARKAHFAALFCEEARLKLGGAQ